MIHFSLNTSFLQYPIPQMEALNLGSYNLSSSSFFRSFNHITNSTRTLNRFRPLSCRRGKIRAVGTDPQSQSQTSGPEEPPMVDFAFVNSVLLPDGTPDVHFRRACGGQKLRNVMMDSNIELYGPYSRFLLNCAGGGTCGTCMVEIVEGKELLNPRTEIEKDKLKKKPKNWRLACQTIVGIPDSRGMLVVQQLPEWKAHEWGYEKVELSGPSESA